MDYLAKMAQFLLFNKIFELLEAHRFDSMRENRVYSELKIINNKIRRFAGKCRLFSQARFMSSCSLLLHVVS